MKLYDIITQQYFENVASGTLYSNGKLAQDVQLLSSVGDAIFLKQDADGNLMVNVDGITFEGNVTVDKVKLINQALAEINPATFEGQTTIGELIYNNHIDLVGAGLKVSQNKKISQLFQTITAIVGNNQNATILVTPPEGYIMKIVGLRLECPVITGATQGSHSVYVFSNQLGSGGGNYAMITSDWNKKVSMRGFGPYEYTEIIPISEGAFIDSVKSAIFNHDNPLAIQYFNNTDHSTSNQGGRIYNLVFSLEPENTALF